MPDFVDNCAGITSVTGTAAYLIDPIGTGRHLRPDQVLTDRQQVAYYAVYESTGTTGFESGLASWSSSQNTLTVLSVTGSSNGNAKVSWGEGNKIIHIVANSAMLDVPVVSPGDLGTPASINGTEKWIAVDGNGDGIDLEAEQVSGNPLTTAHGLGRDRVRFWTQFRNTSPTFSTTTTGTMFGSEPYQIYLNGAGSPSAVQSLNVTSGSALWLKTGTSTTGYAGYRSNYRPFAYNKAKEMTESFQAGFLSLPSVENFSWQAGFTNGTPGAFDNGIYFRLNNSNTKFVAVVRNGSSGIPFETVVDTGVTATLFTPFVMKWLNDPVDEAVKFYIDGVLVATILHSTRQVAANTALAPVMEIAKLAGTTEASCVVGAHYIDVETTALVGY